MFVQQVKKTREIIQNINFMNICVREKFREIDSLYVTSLFCLNWHIQGKFGKYCMCQIFSQKIIDFLPKTD